MKRNIFKVMVVILFSMTLMACTVKHVCPTKKDANGNEYLDKNACSQTTYLAGIIPLG